MSEESTTEFAPEIDDTDVNQFDDSEDEFDDNQSDDADEQESDLDSHDSDLGAQSTDMAQDAETATVFDSAIPEVLDYLDVISTDSALALFALPTTGEPRVDDALGRLGDLESLPVHEHVEVFEDVQRRLHDTLADLAGS
jgi:ribonuclease E